MHADLRSSYWIVDISLKLLLMAIGKIKNARDENFHHELIFNCRGIWHILHSESAQTRSSPSFILYFPTAMFCTRSSTSVGIEVNDNK